MTGTNQVMCSNCGNVWLEKSGARLLAKCPQCGGVNTRSTVRGKAVKNTDPRKGRRWVR